MDGAGIDAHATYLVVVMVGNDGSLYQGAREDRKLAAALGSPAFHLEVALADPNQSASLERY